MEPSLEASGDGHQGGAEHPQPRCCLFTALLWVWGPNCLEIIPRRSTWFRETPVQIKVSFTFAPSWFRIVGKWFGVPPNQLGRMTNNINPRDGPGGGGNCPSSQRQRSGDTPGSTNLDTASVRGVKLSEGSRRGCGWNLILAGVSPGAPPSSPALGKGWEQAELRASWLWWGRMCKGLEQNELEWDCVGQRGWRGSQREGAGGCCGSIPNPLTGAGFHGSPLRPGDLGSCYGSQPPSRSPGARLFQEQLPICLQQEAGNEFRVLLRWRARPSLSLLNSTQFPHIHTPSSFLIPQGRELWLEEATPSTSNPCQLAGRAGRAAILAPPGCRMCHPLPGSGGVRSDPSGDIMEYPGLSASGRASAMQLAWPPPSPSHSSPSASPTPRGWGPTRMGTKPCFSLSLRTSGSCQDTTLVRCLKSHSQTQRIFVAGSLASSLW